MAQVISNTNKPDDLTRNVLDILYYVPKVSSWKISRNEFMLTRIKPFKDFYYDLKDNNLFLAKP